MDVIESPEDKQAEVNQVPGRTDQLGKYTSHYTQEISRTVVFFWKRSMKLAEAWEQG